MSGELAGQPLILMNVGTSLRAYVDLILSAAGITGLEKQVVLELDSVEAIKRMVEAELGLSLLPACVGARRSPKRGGWRP